jgi:hypothetical protein
VTGAIIAIIPFTIAGLVVVLRGWWGEKFDSTRRCRQCGYDLRGFDGTGVTRCSECGAELRTKGAISRTARRSLPGVMRAGILIAAVPWLYLVSFAGPDWIKWRTNRQLIGSISQVRSPGGELEAFELSRRLAVGRLSAKDASAAIDELIKAMRSAGNPSDYFPYFRFVEAASEAGVISSQQYADLGRAAFGATTHAHIEPSVKKYEPCTITIAPTAGPMGGMDCEVDVTWVVATDASTGSQQHIQVHRSGENGFSFNLRTPGTFDVQIQEAFTLSEPNPHGPARTILAQWNQVEYAPLCVTPGRSGAPWHSTARNRSANAPPVSPNLIEDEGVVGFDPQSNGWLSVKAIHVKRGGNGVDLSVSTDVSDAPVGFYFDVIVKVADVEYPCGEIASPPKQAQTYRSSGHAESFPKNATTAEVILRPDILDAAVYETAAWSSPLTFANVPVVRERR